MAGTEPNQNALDAARYTFTATLISLSDIGVPTPFRQGAAALAATVVLLGNTLMGVLLAGVRYVAVPFCVAVLQLISAVRRDNPEGFVQLTTEAMSEFLGFDIGPDGVPTGKGPESVVPRMEALGNKLHTLLKSEFTGSTPITPEEGARNASRFSGFNLNFSTATSLIGLLGEMVSIGQVKQVRELGADMARNLGLGRMHRLALTPLIRNTIQEPYDRYLRKQFRPDLMSDVQYVRAYWAGRLPKEQLQERLAQKGMTDEDIEELIRQIPPDDNQSEIIRLVRYGFLTIDQGVQILMDQGWPKDYADRRLTSALLARVDSTVDTIITEQRAKVLDGFLSIDDFRALLQDLPLLDIEREYLMRDLGLRLETPRSTLTWSQVQDAFIIGVIDFDYLDQWLANQGYSADDTETLELLVLKKLDDKLNKDAVKAKRAAASTKKAGTTTTKV